MPGTYTLTRRRADNYGIPRLAFLGLSFHVADRLPSLLSRRPPCIQCVAGLVNDEPQTESIIHVLPSGSSSTIRNTDPRRKNKQPLRPRVLLRRSMFALLYDTPESLSTGENSAIRHLI
ncbi:hypothetical protein KCU64_g52, partial [Aureobasidium melanogenum]